MQIIWSKNAQITFDAIVILYFWDNRQEPIDF